MTNVIIIGEQPAKKDLKPIGFVYIFSFQHGAKETEIKPKSYENIELICKDFAGFGFDLMFAFDEDRSYGFLYLGHFNDGIV
jgi:L-amino acid N-acyltransferase YncA